MILFKVFLWDFLLEPLGPLELPKNVPKMSQKCPKGFAELPKKLLQVSPQISMTACKNLRSTHWQNVSFEWGRGHLPISILKTCSFSN